MATRIEVKFKEGAKDALGDAIRKRIKDELGIEVDSVRTVRVYTIDKELSKEELERSARELFADPIDQEATIGSPAAENFDWVIEVGFLPGVTDNVGKTSKKGLEDLLKVQFLDSISPLVQYDFFEKPEIKFQHTQVEEGVYSSVQYLLRGKLTKEDVERISKRLHNPLIERVHIKSYKEFKDSDGMEVVVPKVKLVPNERVDEVNLEIPDDELIKLGKEGILDKVLENGKEIRRGPLALSLEELKVIREYFRREGRNPTDVELESIAQTWSEHCKHKIFASRLDEIDSLYKSYIKRATEEIRRALGKDDFCVSVFTDNSGVIRIDPDWNICYKVETHNSPSALDPYGGAITGIVGVNRDPMGTGKGAKLVMNFYGFCFGNPYYDKPLPFRDKMLKNPILHPRVIFEGVRLGVEHGGNKSGIPTPFGFVIFDDRYMGKPLVYVGTMGLMPREINGESSEKKKAMPGDIIVMAGGRVGKDGIHGATFSSESLHEGSPAGAVQIGDPITQKKMHDAQLELRDMGLYRSVTDNGAGGLSCSVGEMAKESGGCEVELEKVPTKYVGLAPWEIWVSESQERMTYAVPKENLERFMEIMKKHDVEATVIGRYTDSGRCVVTLRGKKIMDVDLEFLHNGVPQLRLKSKFEERRFEEPELEGKKELTVELYEMLARLNICSKEYVIRQYDHEVQGGSIIKPLVGVNQDVMSDAVVMRPVLNKSWGVALSTGVFPWYGDIDPSAMAECAIDSAIRNVVCVGACPSYIALLDNFCWCSSDEPERLGELKRAVISCYETATKFKAPFISGKDSMFNDFNGYDEKGNPVKISVPPTLLISAIGKVMDIRKCISLDLKFPGDLIYIIGITRKELGGSEYYAYIGEKRRGKRYIGNKAPRVDVKKARERYFRVYRAIENEILASAHSIGVGGLAVGLAKISMAGELGLEVALDAIPKEGELSPEEILFSETQTRILVSIAEENREKFEDIFKDDEFALFGRVTDEPRLIIRAKGEKIVDAEIPRMKEYYKKTLWW